MPTNPVVLARARLIDAAIQRKKQTMNGSVSALDEVPGAQILPAYIEVFQRHLSPNKIPSSHRNSVNRPSTIMAMACFRAICRGLDYCHHPESGRGFADANSDFLGLWLAIRAWSLHFIAVCTSKSPSVSESIPDFDLTAMKTTTAMCLRSLAGHLSYYKTITADIALHPHLVEFWRESCRSRCHVAVRNLSSLLYSIMVLQEALWVGRFPLEVNPEETARLSFNSVLEDYVDGVRYNDDDLNGYCLNLMRLMCKSPILGQAIIHEESVRFTCTLMRKYAATIMHVVPPSYSKLWMRLSDSVDFVRVSLPYCDLPVVLAMVDNHVLEILLRLWPLLPPNEVYSVQPLIPLIIDCVILYTSYRSVTHCVARSIVSLDKKGIVVDTRDYTPDMVRAWKDLKSLSQNRNVIKEGCDRLPNVCFACRRPYARNMQSCSRCESVQYCSMSCQKTHWKSEHKDKCIKSNISLRDRKYLAYIAQIAIIENEGTLSPIISNYMNEFSITEQASLAIEVDFRESPTTPKFSIKRIGDIAGEVGEIKSWFTDKFQGERNTCGIVRVLAPGGFDQSHKFPAGWTEARLSV